MTNRKQLEEVIDDKFSFDGSGYLQVVAEGVTVNVSSLSIDLTATNTKIDTTNTKLDSAIAKLASMETDIETTNTNLGTLEDDVEAGNVLLGTIDADTSTLAGAVSAGKVLSTETNSGSIKTAVESTKTNSDTITSDLATVKADIALIKADIDDMRTEAVKKVTGSGQQTGTGTVTVSGTRVQVTNTSDTAGMSFTINSKTIYLDVNEQSAVLDFASFTSIIFTLSTGQVANYIVWS
jgi:prefoldin subunit 5